MLVYNFNEIKQKCQKYINKAKEIFGNDKEIFKTIGIINSLKYSNYLISNYGRIKDIKSNEFIRPAIGRKKYKTIGLISDNNFKITFSIDYLVAKVFIPNYNNDIYIIVKHKDEDILNNFYKNLEWTKPDFNLQQDEIFKYIGQIDENYYPYYYISNYGQVLNINKNKLLNPCILQEYHIITLQNTLKQSKIERIHYLVAKLFNDNPENYKLVCHLDGNKLNNYHKNLEWISYSEQSLKYVTVNKPLYQLDIKTHEIINKYNSVTEAFKYNTGKDIRCLYLCCNGKVEYAYGFKWVYEENYDEFIKNNPIIDNNLEGEIWKDIEEYENLYEVSNYGRVRSKKLNYIMKTQFKKGYSRVKLSNNSDSEGYLVHRLVATSFIKNPDNKPSVDHIDGNKSNNNLANLRWATPGENSQYYYDMKPKDENGRKSNNQFTINKQNIILKNDEAFKKIGIMDDIDCSNYEVSNYGNIRNITNGHYLTNILCKDDEYYTCQLYNKRFFVHRIVAKLFVSGESLIKNNVNHIDENKLNNYYKNLEWVTSRENTIHSMGKKIQQLDPNTNEIIKEYRCLADATIAMGRSSSAAIRDCCNSKLKTAYGYKWKYI